MHIFIDMNMITLIICSFQSSIVEISYLDTNLDTRKKFWILFRYFWMPSQIPGNFWGYGHWTSCLFERHDASSEH